MNLKEIIAFGMIALALVSFAGIHDEPDGASVKLLPNGGFQVTAIGSGEYQFNNPTAIRHARSAAEKRAKATLAKFLKEDLSTKEGMDEATKNTLKMYSDGAEQSTAATMESVSSTMESIRNSASALLTGVVVIEDEKIPSEGVGGSYRVKVGVSSKTTQVAQHAANGIAANTGESVAAAAPAAATVATTGGTATATSGSGDLPQIPEGWTLCVGYGADCKKAVQAALIEGISQVYGEQLQNNERMKERMTQMQASTSIMGKAIDTAAMVNTQRSVSETTTKTAGFVREFRIIRVVPKDGNQEATVYANIVNPRAGGTVALMVCKPTMTIEDRTTVYQLGPNRRLSGAEVAKAIQFALPNGLAKANKFIIMTDKSIDAVVENKTATDAMVEAGLAGAQELTLCGQGLTPDCSIRTEITDIKYSKKLGQDKKTKKFGQMYKMSVSMNVTLMNDRTGHAVKSDSIVLSLDNDEIKGLLADNEDVDLLQATLSKLSEPMEAWLKGVKF